MKRKDREDINSTKRKQTEQKKKESIFNNNLLNNREKRWLKSNNSQLKCKITRQYLTEENILKWKPIPKPTKKVLKKLISKTLL
eukprot:jgi/Orpsp1_1/1186070/evm.model.c7180000096739.2